MNDRLLGSHLYIKVIVLKCIQELELNILLNFQFYLIYGNGHCNNRDQKKEK
jgi:hypothetical protein